MRTIIIGAALIFGAARATVGAMSSEDCLFCKIVAGDIPADLVDSTDRAVALSAAVRPSLVSPASAGSMSYDLTTFSCGSPING